MRMASVVLPDPPHPMTAMRLIGATPPKRPIHRARPEAAAQLHWVACPSGVTANVSSGTLLPSWYSVATMLPSGRCRTDR